MGPALRRTGTARRATDGGYDDIVAEEERRGIKTLFVVTGLGGVRADPRAYAAFVGSLAARYKGRVEANEIWNEADEPAFWPGAPDPPATSTCCRRSYTAIKAADPGVKVVFAPTDRQQLRFLEQAYAAGAKGYFDAMAVHTDTACLVDAPSEYYREDGPHRPLRLPRLPRGARDDARQRRRQADLADRDRLVGRAAPCERGRWAGQKAAGVSEAQQAQFLREAYHCLKEDPYVQVAMWFNSRDLRGDGSEINMYGLLRVDGSRRPAYDAFKDVVARRRHASPARAATSAPRRCRSSPRRRTSCSATATGCTSGRPRPTRTSCASRSRYKDARQPRTPPLPQRAASRWTSSRGVPSFRWQGALKLPFGTHTIVVTAIDAQGNETRRRGHGPQGQPGDADAAGAEGPGAGGQRRGLRRSIRGKRQVEPAVRHRRQGPRRVAEQAQGRWKKIHGGSRNAHQPFKFHQTLSTGASGACGSSTTASARSADAQLLGLRSARRARRSARPAARA